MPFKSKAQLEKFGAMVKRGEMSQAEFDKWLHETPNIKGLPYKVKKRKIKVRRKKH